MSEHYCVFGNPIGHSKSPIIHAHFAALTGEDIAYGARLVPIVGFAAAVKEFIAEGGRGANVTVPFKEEAFRLCDHLTVRAQQAEAVNTLHFGADGISGDNTDGAGLVQDLRSNLGAVIANRRVLLLGAGGAARGALGPLLAERPARLFIANRTSAKASALAQHFATAKTMGSTCVIESGSFTDLAGQSFDLVINATSASLAGEVPPLPASVFVDDAWAYDMMYGASDTPFIAAARALGVTHLADGLGMLIGQAAEAFFVWRGVRPPIGPVLKALRAL